MKTSISYLLGIAWSVSLSFGQAGNSSLNDDSAFRQALKQIRYPTLTQLPKREANVYVDFTITREGKISEVKLLKAGTADDSFVGEVNRLIAQLPAQKPGYAGDYVLPVIFESQHEPGSYQSTVSDRAAFTRTFVQLSHSKTLLNELYVTVNH